MPLPPGIETRATSERNDLSTQLSAGGIQAAVLADEGNYLQMLHGMDGVPADQATKAVDATKKPSDRPTSPADWGITRQATSPIALAVDVYNGPAGKGWGYRQHITIAGKLWTFIEWQVNPAGFSDVPWTEGANR